MNAQNRFSWMFRRAARLRRMAAGTSESLRVHQDDVGGVDGHVGACANGDAGVSTGQGGGVVDAVAYHGYLAAGLKLADDSLLAVGQDARDDLVHARLSANGVGGALVVAGEHHHPDAHVLELPDGLGAVRLDGVGHGDDAQQMACAAEEEGRLALSGQLFGLLCQCGRQGKFRSG